MILLADDDPDDQLLVREALAELGWAGTFICVGDGEELLSYLAECRRGVAGAKPCPDLILLDLNMPRMDGREALRHVKQDAEFRRVRVVVLTTSDAPEDVHCTYAWGGQTYIKKPSSFSDLVEMLDVLTKYWFQVATLPTNELALA